MNQKHVDFVLCEPRTTRPLLVIELDDASHNSSDRRRAADAAKDHACRTAGIPMLRVRAVGGGGGGHDTQALARSMAERMGKTGGATAGAAAAGGRA